MVIDARIPLGIQMPQIDDPLTVQTKQLQLRDLMGQQQAREMQMQGAQRARETETTIADIWSEAGGDATRAEDLYALRGLGAQLPALREQNAKAAKEMTERDRKKFELVRDQHATVDQAMRGMLADPQLTQEKVIALMAAQARSFAEFPEIQAKLAEEARSLKPDPGSLRSYLMTKLVQGQDAKTQLDVILPKTETRNMGGADQVFSTNQMTGEVTPGQSFAKTATPGEVMTDARTRSEGAANRGVQMRGQNMAASTAAQGRIPSGYRPRPDGSLEAIPGGPAAAKVSDLTQKVTDATEAIALLNQAAPLLKSSTGSYVGMAVDKLAQAFGASTPGAISAQQLKAIEGALIAKMPKMTGPQSDKDVKLYRDMAGLIGDETIPYDQKAAASDTVREIQERYAGMAPGSSKPKPAAPTQPKPRGGPMQPAAPSADGWTVKQVP